MSTYYVAGLLFADVRSRVMLIRKSHPDWMRGKLNGVGGHIEPEERPHTAMCREFKEETGLNIEQWKKFAVLVGNEETDNPWWIHWYTACVANSCEHKPSFDPLSPGEPVDWYSIDRVIQGFSGITMPNLCWLICMAKERIEGANNVRRYHITEKYTDSLVER
jgi:8-oxo-dGTP pyrophosphatase MutT (NUDIX family)